MEIVAESVEVEGGKRLTGSASAVPRRFNRVGLPTPAQWEFCAAFEVSQRARQILRTSVLGRTSPRRRQVTL